MPINPKWQQHLLILWIKKKAVMEVQHVCSVPKEEFLLEHLILYYRIDCSILLQTMRALGLLPSRSIRTDSCPMPCPLCRTLFSSPEEDDPLLEHFFRKKWETQQWIHFWPITYAFIPHTVMPGHKVRACFCKEKSLEIAQAEYKMEIQ